MKFASVIAAAATALAAPAASAAIRDVDHRELDITLSQVGNSHVKAVVKNTNAEPITLLNHNFFKDVAPIKKVAVFREGSEVDFGGVHRRYKSNDLSSDSFTTLKPGEAFYDIFDIASTSDLSLGGDIVVNAKGAVPFADNDDRTTLVGSVHYRSNDLKMNIDGSKASRVKRAVGDYVKRTEVQCEAGGEYESALTTALENSSRLASQAAQAAQDGDARVEEYFKSTESSVVEEVVERLEAVAAESSNSSSATTYHCEDTLGYCEPNVLAYTLPSENIIANCDLYYEALPDLATECHAQDQGTTTLHEFTHAPGVYSPGTDDLGYGYEAAMELDTEEALNNADSYALFANAVELDC